MVVRFGLSGLGFYSFEILKKKLGLNSEFINSEKLILDLRLKEEFLLENDFIIGDNLFRDNFVLASYHKNDIRSWKRVRALLSLPVRGQRTRTNAKTKKKQSKK